MTKPVLVTGIHRSGSTWVGRMLALSSKIVYIHEPFNPENYRPEICSTKFRLWFTYIAPEIEGPYYSPLKKTVGLQYNLAAALARSRHLRGAARRISHYLQFSLARIQHKTALIKDPIAVFSSEWLASRLGLQPVVLIRHPAAFTASLIKQNWTFTFDHFLKQPLLMEHYLHPFEAEISQYTQREMPLLDQACLLWKIIYSVVGQFQDNHPDWLFVRHEDISREPAASFENLYSALGLKFTDEIRQQIEASSNSENPSEAASASDKFKRSSKAIVHNWKTRLSQDDIAYIRSCVEPIASRYYSDTDW